MEREERGERKEWRVKEKMRVKEYIGSRMYLFDKKKSKSRSDVLGIELTVLCVS